MGCTIYMLEDVFMSAYRTGANFVAVKVRGVGVGDEIIINPSINILEKLAYYKANYTEHMELKHNKNIRIVCAVYGNSLREIEYLL